MTFLNAAFLFAALAALLPLIIHLISRRRVETVDWSSLRFLKELERKRIRRVRIRQILLLVIRSLIILLVALALARPTVRGPLAAGAARARTSVAILLDESASMTREAGDMTLFGAAMARAREIAALLNEGDEAFLVSAADPPETVIPEGTVSPDVLLEALSGRAPTDAATDYTGAVEKALSHLADARNLNRELYVVGDLAASGWSGSPSLPEATGAGDRPPGVYVLPLRGPVSNVGVVSVTRERIYGGTAGRYSVAAQVANTGTRPVDIPVRLFVDGVQVGQTGVAVDPGRSATARFAVALDETEWHAGRVALSDDAFPGDDERHFVVPPSRSVEVLIAGPGGALEDATYLRHALDPTGGSERFRPVVVEMEDVARQEQGRFPVVALADAGPLGPDAERWLRQHVGAGGGLLVVLGSRTDLRTWEGSVLSELTGVGLIGPVERRGGLRLAPAGRGHPLLEGLVTGERLIEDVLVRRALQAEAGGEVVLELPGVGPALVFSDRSGGSVATLLFGLERSSGDLARSGLVVPLLHRVAARLTGQAPGVGDGTAGRALDLELAVAPAGRVDVVSPDGSATAAPVSGGTAPAVKIEETREAGVYRVVSGGTTIAMAAVNIDPDESSLEPASPEDVEGRLTGLPVRFIGESEVVAEAVLTSRRGRELWRVFLYAALALLAAEMFLARPRQS